MAEPEAPVYAGERVRAVRLLLGTSQTDLADALGVTQAQISHIESGRRVATPELLDRPSAVTGYPRSYFDAVPADLPPLTLRFRKKATARSSEVHRAEQLVAETYRVVWQLVHERGRYLPPPLPLTSGENLSLDLIEDLAIQTRGKSWSRLHRTRP